jgi:hypothetical protein
MGTITRSFANFKVLMVDMELNIVDNMLLVQVGVQVLLVVMEMLQLEELAVMV